jgi:hypothetical protein
MLSELVFEQLTRDAPLTKSLVEEAWPDLAVESKLQIISALQKTSYATTPTWLMQLAIADKVAVVRYWAARHYTFTDEFNRVWPPHMESLNRAVPEFEKELRARAVADPSALVNACASKNPWDKENQLNRLVFIRSHGTSGLISGLNKAFEDGFSDDDLADSFQELIAKKEVQEDLKFTGQYSEGDAAYYEGKVVTDGWALVAEAGPKLQRLLAHHLPTDRGLGHVTPETLASMPVRVLEAIAYRATKSRETEKALELVATNPEKYGEPATEAVKKALGNVAQWEWERSQGNTPPAVLDSQEETLARVDSLSQQISNLAEQLDVLQRQLSSKRGLFF